MALGVIRRCARTGSRGPPSADDFWFRQARSSLRCGGLTGTGAVNGTGTATGVGAVTGILCMALGVIRRCVRAGSRGPPSADDFWFRQARSSLRCGGQSRYRCRKRHRYRDWRRCRCRHPLHGIGCHPTVCAGRFSGPAFGGRFLVPSSPVLTSLRRLDGYRCRKRHRYRDRRQWRVRQLCMAWLSSVPNMVGFRGREARNSATFPDRASVPCLASVP